MMNSMLNTLNNRCKVGVCKLTAPLKNRKGLEDNTQNLGRNISKAVPFIVLLISILGGAVLFKATDANIFGQAKIALDNLVKVLPVTP